MVVSAAAGAVGSVVGQIAKIKGCRAVGVAGERRQVPLRGRGAGPGRLRRTTRRQDLDRGLADACPDGIDVYYDNVGGKVLASVLGHINRGARIPLVGLISQYNATGPPPGPDLMPLLVNRALVQGFIVSDHPDREADFLRDVSGWLEEGKLKYREEIVEGLENAPRAFLGLFRGENFGKLIVRVGTDPTRGGA